MYCIVMLNIYNVRKINYVVESRARRVHYTHFHKNTLNIVCINIKLSRPMMKLTDINET